MASKKEPHTVWNVPGINKTEFYAACIYMNTVQKQQAKTALMPGPQGEPETSQTTRDFLDNVADCFARSKESDSPQHVTATAMVKNFKVKVIVIAKNRAEDYSNPGPEASSHTADDTSKDGADSIREDAGSTTGLNPSEDDRDVWEEMLKFNDSRVKNCIKKAKKAKDNETAIKKALERLPRASEEQKSRSQKAWAVVDLCNNFTDLTSLESKSRCIDKAEACRLDPGFSCIRRIVRKERENNVQKKKDYKDLSEFIKFIDLLGRLRHAFKTLQQYYGSSDGEGKGCHFTLKFLDSAEYSSKYPSKYSWPQDCSSKIEEWYELNPEHRKKLPQGFKNKAMAKAELGANKHPHYFHCELQLLKHFIDHPCKECQDYFGCSKRSCWLCWSILTYVDKFHTKDSHEKIYHSWVFPVHFSPEGEKLLLSKALTRTYRDLVMMIRQKIFVGRGFAEHEVQTETSGRAPEMAPVVNKPDSRIRRIALRETDRQAVREFRCVCFPENSRTPCEVIVELYHCNYYDLFEYMQPPFLASGSDPGNRLLPAFMLVNKPLNENSFADQSWAVGFFPYAYNSEYGKGDLRLYFQSNQSNPNAERNRWISNQLTEENKVPRGYWEEVTAQEDFLWRGSIFAVMIDYDSKQTSLLREDFAVVTEVESFLAEKFKSMTPEKYYEHSKDLAEQRQHFKKVEDRFSKY